MYRKGFKEEGKSGTGYMLASGVSLCKWGSAYCWPVSGTWWRGSKCSVLGLERRFIQCTWEQAARKVWFLFWPIRVKDCVILIPDRLWSQLLSCSSLGWLWWLLSLSDYFMTIWKHEPGRGITQSITPVSASLSIHFLSGLWLLV